MVRRGREKSREVSVHQKYVFVIGLVPKGKVATYGQIAAVAGHPGGARQVVWTLHSSSRKYRLPWHRIVNAQGRVALTNERDHTRQTILLRREGVEFGEHGKIDLKEFRWKPRITIIRKRLRKLGLLKSGE